MRRLGQRTPRGLRLFGQAQHGGKIGVLEAEILERPAPQQIRATVQFLERARAQGCEPALHVSRDEGQEGDGLIVGARELRAQDGVLRCDAHGTGILVALSRVDAAERDQERAPEAELVGAEQ